MRFPQLLRSPLFKGLTEREINDILDRTNYREKFYPEGSLISLCGETISSLMIVLSGHVRGEMLDLSGHVIKIEDIYPPQALASAFMFGQKSQYPVNVIANTDTRVLIIDKNDYLGIMHDNRAILVNYLDVICNRARFLSDRLGFLSFHTIKGKLAHYILTLAGAGTGNVMTDRSQQQLADYFGVARPSLARALKELEEAGIINVERRAITILKPEILASLAHS